MQDISIQNWEAMAEFNNAIIETINQSSLTPAEIIVVLEIISSRLKQLLEMKKGKVADGS